LTELKAPGNTRGHTRLHLTLLLLTVGLAAFAAYMPVMGGYFRHDDFSWLRVARQWEDGSRSLAHGDAGVTPVYNLIYYALYRRHGMDARAQLVALLLAHAVATGLAAWLVALLTRSRAAALAGGLCFALMFSHQEAVAWPAGWSHLYRRLQPLPPAAARRPC